MTQHSVSPQEQIQEATLAGGCFWCLDAVFSQLEGVTAVECGYANGQVPNPSYEQVCRGDSGHAEVVRVAFDSAVVDFRTVLGVFFSIHDPTTLNRQGNDVGTQYRSGIYWHNPEQEQVARAFVQEINQDATFGAPLVTELAPLASYYPAEPEHQRYFEQHPGQGYCAYVIAPKVHKFRKQFASRLRQS